MIIIITKKKTKKINHKNNIILCIFKFDKNIFYIIFSLS